MKQVKCDEIISLGYNCEISFRIENYLGTLNSFPFSWTYVLDRKLFVEALNDIDHIHDGDNEFCTDPRVNSMICYNKYKLCFHPRGEYCNPNGTIIENKYNEAIEELNSRIDHLVYKFKEILNSNKKILFIVSVTNNGEMPDNEYILGIFNSLNKLSKNKDFILVAVLQKKELKKDLKNIENERLKIRTVKKFGTQRCNDIFTDSIGWYKIFSEFYKEKHLSYFFRLTSHRILRCFGALIHRLKNK